MNKSLIDGLVGELSIVELALYDSTQFPTTEVVRAYSFIENPFPFFKSHESLLTYYLVSVFAHIQQTEIKKHLMKAALARGVSTGELVQVKASYKISPEAKKKAASKAKAAKKDVEKKKDAPKKKKVRTVA